VAKGTSWILSIALALMLVLIAGTYVLVTRYDYNALKPRISDTVMELTGRELAIRGNIELHIGMNPSIVVEDVVLRNADWGSRPDMVRVERLEAEVEMRPLLSGIVAVKRLLLIGPVFFIETDADGKSNLDFHTAPNKKGGQSTGITYVIRALPSATFKEIALQNGTLDYRDGRSGKTYTVALRHLTAITPGADAPIEVALKGDIGHEAFEVEGTTGSLQNLRDPERPWPLNLTASALGGTATFKGFLGEPFASRDTNLDFIIQVPDLKNLSDLAGQGLPATGPLQISGGVAHPGGSNDDVSDLNTKLGENRISGSLKMQLDKNPPIVSATLESDRLDLRPLVGPYVKSAKERVSRGRSRKIQDLFPQAPIPTVDLKDSTVALTLRAGEILLPGLTVHNLSANTTITERGLEVDPLSMMIGGAVVDGWVRVEPSPKGAKVSARLRSEGIDLAQMAKEAGVKDTLGGRLSAAVDLKGTGRTLSDLMDKADGQVILVSHAARLDDKYMKILGTEVEAGLFRMLNPFREPEGYTEFDCMEAVFDIHGGVARSRALSLASEDSVVVGDGSIDLGTESLDIGLKSFPRKGVAGVTINLGELMSSFRLEGTLLHPSLVLEPADTALALGKAVGSFFLFGPMGIVTSLITRTKGADNLCVADLGAFRKDAEVRGKAVE
jgi:uncharacterized protein involved in outer membrane biogenesis